MLKISRESEINLINLLIDQDIISGKDLANIKKISNEQEKSQLDAVFELNLTDEDKILDLLVKEQSLDVVDLSNIEVTDEIKVRVAQRLAMTKRLSKIIFYDAIHLKWILFFVLLPF